MKEGDNTIIPWGEWVDTSHVEPAATGCTGACNLQSEPVQGASTICVSVPGVPTTAHAPLPNVVRSCPEEGLNVHCWAGSEASHGAVTTRPPATAPATPQLNSTTSTSMSFSFKKINTKKDGARAPPHYRRGGSCGRRTTSQPDVADVCGAACGRLDQSCGFANESDFGRGCHSFR